MSLPPAAKLKGALIVSVQAPPGSPMRNPDVIAAIAEASLINGAVGVRLESPEHIGAVRRRCPDALIIGLWKRTFPGSDVYITPRWEEINAVWAAGADVVALDATARVRPDGINLADLLTRVRQQLGAVVMGDVDSIENGLRAAALGCDWLGTTLYGYTDETSMSKPPALDLLKSLRLQLPEDRLLICEGGISSAAMGRQALKQGADAVVVGTAITGVDLQVSNYCKQLLGA